MVVLLLLLLLLLGVPLLLATVVLAHWRPRVVLLVKGTKAAADVGLVSTVAIKLVITVVVADEREAVAATW